MATLVNTSEIAIKIEKMLIGITGSKYFTVEDCNGDDVKIRVSDHSANKKNNNCKTLSFVSNKTTATEIGRFLQEEWQIVDGLTDTYQTIEEVLEWELN